MQNELSCRTTQHLESRNRQSNDWKTNRLIPRRGHVLLHWVFLRLKVQIGERFFLCHFLLDPFLCLCFGERTTLLKTITAFLTSLSCLSFLWTTKKSPLLTTIRIIVPVHRQRMRSSGPFGSSFTFSFSFSFTSLHLAAHEWSGLPGIQAYSLSSLVQ